MRRTRDREGYDGPVTSNASIPTEEDLVVLPYFAILALGARSARYAEPVYRSWNQASDEQLRDVSNAIRAVEDLTGCPDAATRAPLWASAADALSLAIAAASAADCADAPASVLHAADSAAELSGAIDPHCRRRTAARAVLRSIQASASALEPNGSARDAFVAQIGRDVERLRIHTAERSWSEETGVALAVLDS